MRMRIDGWSVFPSTSITLLAGIILSACCPKPAAPPRPAAACPRDSAPSTPEELDACLKGLVFDGEYGVSDSQPLTIIDSAAPTPTTPTLPCPGDASGRLRCRYGPLAKIEPAIGAQRYSDADLRQGRIIARLWIPGSEKVGYRKYGLQPGDSTYWWVKMDEKGTGGTSVFITRNKDRTLAKPVTRTLRREPESDDYRDGNPEYKGRQWWRATARWLWTLVDETAKGKCGAGSCT